MTRWHQAARKFVADHLAELRTRPVWLFSSGPLDDSAGKREVPPTPQVAKLMKRIGARGHATFGGRLAPDASGFIAHAMAKKLAGDWRDWAAIRAWAKRIAQQILVESPKPVVILPEHSRTQRWLLAGLCLFTGITAVGGGATLAARPDGSLLEAPPGMLAHSPFSTFLIPGLLLVFVVGLGNLLAGVLVLRESRLAPYLAFFAGTALLVWIVSEMLLLHTTHWLQLGYLAIAVLTLLEAWKQFHVPWRHAGSRYAAV
jgi:hypothetical protein